MQRRREKPLPYLVAQYLREAVRQGKLRPGQRLPGEYQLAEQFNVSRATLRAAIQMLLAHGVLERRHGVGTFVTDSSLLSIEEGLESLVSTTEIIRQHGYEPGTSQIRSEIIPASSQLSEILKVPTETPLLHLSRTRTANQKPVIQSEEYLPTSFLNFETSPPRPGDWSLYELLKSTGAPVVSAVCKVTAVAADGNLSQELKVPLHYPLLLLRQIHYSAEHVPVLYCENYHNSSMIEFQVLRHS